MNSVERQNNSTSEKPCIQKRLKKLISEESAPILLGIYTLFGILFFNFLHETANAFFIQEGLDFPSVSFTIEDVKNIGIPTGILSGLSIVFFTGLGKKRGLPIILLGNSISLGIINLGLLPIFKPVEPTIGPFFLGELLALGFVVIFSSYFIFKRANQNFSLSQNGFELRHARLRETFRFFSSAIIAITTGGIIAILILSYEMFSLEVITGVSFTRFLGTHLAFGAYLLFGFLIGCNWQILHLCKEIEEKI